jgi:hypothetical protein
VVYQQRPDGDPEILSLISSNKALITNTKYKRMSSGEPELFPSAGSDAAVPIPPTTIISEKTH